MKKQIKIKSRLILIISIFFTACIYSRDAKVIEKEVSLTGFNELNISGAIDAYIRQGDNYTITIKADEDIIDKVYAELNGAQLKVYTRNFNRSFRVLEVHITMPELTALSASGSCDVEIINTLNADDLRINLSGSSDIEMAVNAKKIHFKLSGSSDVDISGSSDEVTISASGSSDFDGNDFKVEFANLQLSGSSDVFIYVNRELSVTARGSSDIIYKGNAQIVKSELSGSSDLVRR
jgi:hypothetical protein